MEESRKSDYMLIPEHCATSGSEICEGYGKVELLKSIPFAVVGLGIGIFLRAFFIKSLTVPVLGLVIGSAAGFVFCKKDKFTRESIFDMLNSFRKFKKSQKFYEFRRD